MGKTKRERFIWEEISDFPCIYRVSRTDSEDNSYLILEGGEALIIDPRSEKMLENICRLACGLGAEPEKMQVYLTNSDSESGRTIMGCVPGEMTLYCRKEAETPSIQPAPSAEQVRSTQSAPSAEQVRSTQPVPSAEQVRSIQPAPSAEQEEPRRARTLVRDGDSINIGEVRLYVLNMEGCVREQTGLWIPEQGILFAGDAIRSGRAPEVRTWDPAIDMLSLQIEVLRRIRRLSVQCILPGRGPCPGVDILSGDNNKRNGQVEKFSPECLEVLDSTLAQYCVQILEVYQKIPVKGQITEEELIAQDDLSGGSCSESCLRYLLYRKYIHRNVLDDGVFYERGSIRLTDWTLGFGS